MIYEKQIKGLVAICLMLAIIPFFILFSRSFTGYKIPVLTNQCSDCLAIEIVAQNRNAGIYFVAPGTTAKQLLKSAGISPLAINDFQLENGMKIDVNSASEKQNLVVTKIAAAERLALGMTLDINQVTEDELLLIKGIGPSTAEKILALRKELSRFKDMKQLLEIRGIKEKKLAEIKKYLYVEKQP